MVQGAFGCSTEGFAQRGSWGRVMSRPSGGMWQQRRPGARKPEPAQTHESLWAGTGANHSLSLPKTYPPVLMMQVVYNRGTVTYAPRSLRRPGSPAGQGGAFGTELQT